MKVLRPLAFALVIVVVIVVNIVLLQVVHRASVSALAYIVLAFVYLFPWGFLIASLGIQRRLKTWLAIRTFCATLVAWAVAFLVYYAAIKIVSAYGGRHASIQIIVPAIGALIACSVFGLIQFAGWSPRDSLREGRSAFFLLVGVSGLIGLISFELCIAAFRILCAALGWRNLSAMAILGSVFGPAAIFITAVLTSFLKSGPSRISPASTLVDPTG